MTFLEIKNQVLQNVIDLPPTVAASVPKLINDAIRTAERRYSFKYMEAIVSYVTSPGVLALGTLTRFKEFRERGAVLFHQLRKAETLRLTPTNGEPEKDTLLNTSYPKKPQFIKVYLLDAVNTISLNNSPYPDALSDWSDGNYRITVFYNQYSAVAVNDGDTNWLINNADDYIILKATAEAFKKDWDYNSAAIWVQDAENKFNEIKLADKRQRVAGIADVLVPHWQGANQGMVNK